MIDSPDFIILIIVILSRLLVPLLIPRYPLPAIIVALIIDGVDQTIFQKFTNLDLVNYQSYDKALDIYYLMIAYMSTMRNWGNLYAVKIARFLFIYRLIGVALFELTYTGEGPRWLMLIFPNVFEYFFIFYETIRLRWDPTKISKRVFLFGAAFIWVFIKLPQEYWIHIAQMDVTDFLKENIFGMPVTAGWTEIIKANLWVIPVTILSIVAIALLIKFIYPKLPKADHKLKFKAISEYEKLNIAKIYSQNHKTLKSYFDSSLAEKILLISLIVIIFSQILPGVKAGNIEIIITVVFLIISNTLASFLSGKNKGSWKSALREFLGVMTLNFALIYVGVIFLQNENRSFNVPITMFFLFLLSIMITLYDRYRPFYEGRLYQQDLEK